VFTGRFTASEPGRHEVIVSCKQTNATLETSFFVQGVATERIGRPARPDVLNEIARVTRGRVIEPEKLEDAVKSLASLPEPQPSRRRVQLWSHPVPAGLIVLLMGIFWAGRKTIGLI
jgi:hypothetical protein